MKVTIFFFLIIFTLYCEKSKHLYEFLFIKLAKISFPNLFLIAIFIEFIVAISINPDY